MNTSQLQRPRQPSNSSSITGVVDLVKDPARLGSLTRSTTVALFTFSPSLRFIRSMLRWSPLLSVIVAVCLCTGCQSESIEGKTSLHEMDHSVPEHWPTSVADASNKLKERATAISGLGQGSDEYKQTVNELEDLLSWVPEVAADTDMPEATWDVVAKESITLTRNLREQGVSEELCLEIVKLSDALASTWAAESNGSLKSVEGPDDVDSLGDEVEGDE